MERKMAVPNEDIVIFVIGLRVNRWRSIRKWWPAFSAMPAMLKELYTNRDSGFLSHEMTIGWRSVTLIQYWRSSEELLDYAHGKLHLEAWKTFNQKARASEVVGIFHETYEVSNYETMYVNLPTRGLGKALGDIDVVKTRESAKERLAERRMK
ncbi:transcriptional regulator [Exiguobacterium sp. SH31]|uniref:DUF4188 domain-containing protein n=1 Tax=unclassified Exiguobacterium TaxID=2644629 RepID=UPI0008C3DE2E|nr:MULTISPECIES: DUF4188 domain-containing protein [unclassified Exiguobacterium]OGX79474.1 transcriptional regulator [Exiguobacterium sp. SH31]TCI70429.1 DUF4188 domain-containing protein [Exiguobacterium sp. SH0S7]